MEHVRDFARLLPGEGYGKGLSSFTAKIDGDAIMTTDTDNR
ncbi:hypothetical protein JOC58_002186 [Paenibacillus hunanensis]|uniref:Uncharacterized protein n=1 Tax=Paenibacillus hunanensis TaxID=539262 RepID=A0ABU1IYF3_9BACL|nr:hypothetical protein [Paenibacillus hunanensis]